MHSMISVVEAWRLLEAHAPAVNCHTVPLQEALGRTLAAPVISNVTQPPHAVSAMDGYAVRLTDVREAGAQLEITGEAPAGRPFDGVIGKGQAVRIFTGGYVPAGADHIVIQEETEPNGAYVTCQHAQTKTQFVRPQGLDFKNGETLLPVGTTLNPQTIALAAAGNVETVNIASPMRVGMLANGDELKPVGSLLRDGEIVNSISPAMVGLVSTWGGIGIDLGIAADSESALLNLIHDTEDYDLLVTIGGASVGDYDYVKPAFQQAGFELIFSKIAVRPGKPTWLAKRNNQRVLGLPGNPASALVCAHLFLKPLISRRQVSLVSAMSTASLPANGTREHYMRAIMTTNKNGTLSVTALQNQDSSLLSPFREANALIRRMPNAPALQEGDVTECIQLN